MTKLLYNFLGFSEVQLLDKDLCGGRTLGDSWVNILIVPDKEHESRGARLDQLQSNFGSYSTGGASHHYVLTLECLEVVERWVESLVHWGLVNGRQIICSALGGLTLPYSKEVSHLAEET